MQRAVDVFEAYGLLFRNAECLDTLAMEYWSNTTNPEVPEDISMFQFG
jgi:hypothetical protein